MQEAVAVVSERWDEATNERAAVSAKAAAVERIGEEGGDRKSRRKGGGVGGRGAGGRSEEGAKGTAARGEAATAAGRAEKRFAERGDSGSGGGRKRSRGSRRTRRGYRGEGAWGVGAEDEKTEQERWRSGGQWPGKSLAELVIY